MKSKLLLIGLVLTLAGCADVNAAQPSKADDKTKPIDKSKPTTAAKPNVKDSQVEEMRVITDEILAGAKGVSGPSELFKAIKGQTQIAANERETPLSGAVTRALEKGYQIVCYENGKVVAATDPTLLGKDSGAFTAVDGNTVLSMAVSNLQASGNDRSFFTYELASSDAPLVNGKRISSSFVAEAVGRNAFPFPLSGSKYLIIVVAGINL